MKKKLICIVCHPRRRADSRNGCSEGNRRHSARRRLVQLDRAQSFVVRQRRTSLEDEARKRQFHIAGGGSVPHCWDTLLGAAARTRQLIEFLADPRARVHNTRRPRRRCAHKPRRRPFLRHSGMETKHDGEGARREVRGKLRKTNIYYSKYIYRNNRDAHIP